MSQHKFSIGDVVRTLYHKDQLKMYQTHTGEIKEVKKVITDLNNRNWYQLRDIKINGWREDWLELVEQNREDMELLL